MHLPPTGNFQDLLHRFDQQGVQYIIVGGVAGVLHGSMRVTYDLDIVYARTPENLQALAESLADLEPYPRGAPPGLPFEWSAKTLHAGLNFTLNTPIADIDLLGEIAGGGSYDDLLPHTEQALLYGISCKYLTLDALIRTKRGAGRPKDFEAIAELEALRDHPGRHP